VHLLGTRNQAHWQASFVEQPRQTMPRWGSSFALPRFAGVRQPIPFIAGPSGLIAEKVALVTFLLSLLLPAIKLRDLWWQKGLRNFQCALAASSCLTNFTSIRRSYKPVRPLSASGVEELRTALLEAREYFFVINRRVVK
jgi:hypothetical protein